MAVFYPVGFLARRVRLGYMKVQKERGGASEKADGIKCKAVTQRAVSQQRRYEGASIYPIAD